ncbi:hypothetical protein J4E89_010628 [Alternaria sp. Ai002NY15]|nr:hypothetical protein J4E89_010628 [Alternaria sp. Ai002NY15]
MTSRSPVTSSTGNVGLEHDAEDTDTAQKSTSPRDHLGTIAFKTSSILRECELYINGFPGRDSISGNHIFHQCIRGFISGSVKPTEENLDAIHDMISYRNNLARLAMHLLNATNIPQPKGLDIFDFDKDNFEKRMSATAQVRCIAAWQNLHRNLLPRPVEDKHQPQGLPWQKPNWYIATAIALDKSIKTNADIEGAVERMMVYYRDHCQEFTILLHYDGELTYKQEPQD